MNISTTETGGTRQANSESSAKVQRGDTLQADSMARAREMIVRALLREAERPGGMSLSRIARRADLPTSTVTRFVSGETGQVSLETVERLAAVLGLEIKVVKKKTTER